MGRMAWSGVRVAPMTDAETSHDVAVLGGGPAGSAVALELARHGQRVLVLERSLYDDVRVGETLPPQAATWLRRLGIPDPFASVQHLPAPSVVQQWGTPTSTATPLISNDDRHGWHVDRPRFDAMLADAAEQVGAIVCRGAVARSCQQRGDDGWRVQFDWNGRRNEVHARWLIDATGRRSWLLHRQGVHPSAHDHLVGLMGYGGPRVSGDLSLVVEATPMGWWYSAPLPGQRSIAAFMTDGDLIPRDRRSLGAFWEEQRARSKLISRLNGAVPSVRAVVARTAWSGTAAAGRWLAVGDAAMAFDPLFGRGIYLALASGWSAARALLEVPAQGASAIRRYQAWLESQYRDYLAQRRHVYGGVARWPDSAFWQRRAS